MRTAAANRSLGVVRIFGLGGKQRRTELKSGAVQMGVRSYVPQLGRFLQVDPVAGGSANAYDYVNQDPLNNTDIGGLQTRPQEGELCRLSGETRITH